MMDDKPANPDRRRAIGVAAIGVAAGAAMGVIGGIAAASASASPAPVVFNGSRRFEGKVVLVTGATSGIGRAAAEAFAREGGKVVFCGRREALGREVEAGIRAAGGEGTFIQTDVRDEQQINRFVAQSVEMHGGLDIALNNAGVSFRHLIHETSASEWDDLQNTNVRGVFLCMKAQIPHLLTRGGGQILVTSSVNIAGVRPGLSAYGASKRALTALVHAGALEYADRGIRVNAICPGTTDTEMVRKLSGLMDVPEPARKIAQSAWAASNIPGLKRMATSEEMATAILALASPEMGYMNGSMVMVDGGMTAAL